MYICLITVILILCGFYSVSPATNSSNFSKNMLYPRILILIYE